MLDGAGSHECMFDRQCGEPAAKGQPLDSEFLTVIQRLDPGGKGKRETLEELLRLAVQGFFKVPVQYLQPLIVILDPDYDCSQMLLQMTLELVSYLVREPYYASFFGQPHQMQLIWGYYPDPKAMTCIEYILGVRPQAVQVLLENDLKGVFEAMSESVDESDLRLVSICLKVAPEIFEAPTVLAFLQSANALLVESEDTNLKYEALSLIAQVTARFPESVQALEPYYAGYPMINEDDCTTSVLLQIYSNMLKAMKSFEPFLAPPVLGFFLGLIERKSEWIRSVLVFFNTSGVDIKPLAQQETLVQAVFSILPLDVRFEVRELALLFVSNVLRECNQSMCAKILEWGYMARVDESVSSCQPHVQLSILAAVLFFIERKQVDPESLSDTFISALQNCAAADNPSLSSVAQRIVDLLN